MKRISIKLLLPLLLTLLLVPVAAVAGVDEGFAAYSNGEFAKALKEWKPLAKRGNATAQSSLGRMYEKGQGVAQDYNEAVHWYRLAADKGDAFAQSNLGGMYEKGQGVTLNVEEAVRWYRLAADQGHTFAHLRIAFIYRDGLGAVEMNQEESLRMFRIAADQGIAVAQHQVGFLLCGPGSRLPQNCKEAVRMIRMAAEQGNAQSQYSLGEHYSNGVIVAKDYAESMRWFRKAAVGSDPIVSTLSLRNISYFYEHGRGVPVNLVAVYAIRSFLDGGVRPSDPESAKSMDKLIQDMYPQSIKEAQELTRKMLAPGQLFKALDDYLK